MSLKGFKTKWVQDRLQELKEVRGINGAAVGRRMKLSRSRISQVKRGRAIDDDFIQRFAEAFGFKFPVDTSTDTVDKGPPSEREAQLTQAVHDMVKANVALREELTEVRGMMRTQANSLNLLTETVGVYKEAIARLEKKVDALPARLKIAQ